MQCFLTRAGSTNAPRSRIFVFPDRFLGSSKFPFPFNGFRSSVPWINPTLDYRVAYDISQKDGVNNPTSSIRVLWIIQDTIYYNLT